MNNEREQTILHCHFHSAVVLHLDENTVVSEGIAHCSMGDPTLCEGNELAHPLVAQPDVIVCRPQIIFTKSAQLLIDCGS